MICTDFYGFDLVLPRFCLRYLWSITEEGRGGLEENGNLTSMWLSGGLFFPGPKHEAL